MFITTLIEFRGAFLFCLFFVLVTGVSNTKTNRITRLLTERKKLFLNTQGRNAEF